MGWNGIKPRNGWRLDFYNNADNGKLHSEKAGGHPSLDIFPSSSSVSWSISIHLPLVERDIFFPLWSSYYLCLVACPEARPLPGLTLKMPLKTWWTRRLVANLRIGVKNFIVLPPTNYDQTFYVATGTQHRTTHLRPLPSPRGNLVSCVIDRYKYWPRSYSVRETRSTFRRISWSFFTSSIPPEMFYPQIFREAEASPCDRFPWPQWSRPGKRSTISCSSDMVVPTQ